MNRKSLVLLFNTFLLAILLEQGTMLRSQTSQTKPLSNPIKLSIDSELDSSPFLPSDRNQSSEPLDPKTREGIGKDDRLPILSGAFPWSAIGRLEWESSDGRPQYSCTGTLIGRDLVLTNAHCIFDKMTNQPTQSPILFKPNLIRGRSSTKARVVTFKYGENPYTGSDAEDWALLKINRPLGDRYGYLGWKNLDFSDGFLRVIFSNKFILAGYSADFPTDNLISTAGELVGKAGETAGADVECSIMGIVPEGKGNLSGVILHDCDSYKGASGAAIIVSMDGKYYVAGLHSGAIKLSEPIETSDGEVSEYINQGVQVSRWASTALEMR